ncbi:MAG: hypothetical protein N2376_07410, partial [Clostridia bacterium]|nr:hypothetical protein [Clostridia bacterium]
MQPITFPKAGKLLLNRYVNGVPVKSASTSFFRAGAVQSIVPSIELKTSTLPDGNSDWDAAELDTGKGGTIIINLSFMSPELYAFLLGTDVEDLTSTVMPVVDWEITVPETSPYT